MFAALLTSCTTESTQSHGPKTGSTAAVDEIHLFGVPVTLDFDQKAGPDGFAIRVFASRRAHTGGVPIANGSLEVLMFDGAPTIENGKLEPPRRTWKFAAGELKPYAGRSALGTGYRFALRWEDAGPRHDRITIVARYLPPHGPAVSSAPSTISVATK